VTLYHGDCRELLPSIEADVLITDPPYGVSFAGKVTKHTKASGGYLGEDDPLLGPSVVGMLLGKVKRAAVFPGIRLLHDYPRPDDIGCVYCPSGAGIGRWGFTCFHPVLFYGPRIGTLQPSSIQSFDTADTDGHPCPKPMRWLRWLVNLATEPDDVVLDPFAGSGTTLMAAKELGRRSVGIELEEAYCEEVAIRCRQEVLGLVV
jgi:site-specific DNA-methyltransferase (adenine-specific)